MRNKVYNLPSGNRTVSWVYKLAVRVLIALTGRDETSESIGGLLKGQCVFRNSNTIIAVIYIVILLAKALERSLLLTYCILCKNKNFNVYDL